MRPRRHPLDRRPLCVGMVHLGPLPGSAGADGSIEAVARRALADALALADASFDAVLVENYGDAPFFKDRVPAETVAALSAICARLRDALPARVAMGVNVLRNDALSAIAVACAAQLDFVRVNVLQGAVLSDQGVIEGRAAEVLRARERLRPQVRIFADLRVKHAVPLVERRLEDEAHDLVQRGRADAVLVTGARTGLPAPLGFLREVRAAIGETPLLVASGARATTVGAMLEVADGVIVGSALKARGSASGRVSPRLAASFRQAAHGA